MTITFRAKLIRQCGQCFGVSVCVCVYFLLYVDVGESARQHIHTITPTQSFNGRCAIHLLERLSFGVTERVVLVYWCRTQMHFSVYL